MIEPLKDIIKAHIKSQGPISIAAYMDYCLLHPKYGYYTTQESIGAKGDFITAPEISQCFGEMVGVWALDLINQILEHKDEPIQLVEIGPGRGVLMYDILSTVLRFVATSKIKVYLIEASPKLKQLQEKKLSAFDVDIHWLENLDELPKQTTFFIANEFFDALPIHQYFFDGEKWGERLIGLDEKNEFQFGMGPHMPVLDQVIDLKRNKGEPLTKGTILEDSPISARYMQHIASHVEACGGGALIIDYGYATGESGDTFQAMANHGYVDPLQKPGKVDLTAHVNFGALVSQIMGKDIALYPVMKQGEFLTAYGIYQRAEQLVAKNPKEEKNIKLAIERLCDNEQMGQLFKVLQITEKNICPQIFTSQE